MAVFCGRLVAASTQPWPVRSHQQIVRQYRVNAGIAAARSQGTKFGRPPVNPEVVERKLAIAAEERAKGRTAEEAARLVGWSRATLYRHQRDAAARESIAQA